MITPGLLWLHRDGSSWALEKEEKPQTPLVTVAINEPPQHNRINQDVPGQKWL